MSRRDWTDEKLFLRLLTNKSDKSYWDNIRIVRSRPTHTIFTKCIDLTMSPIPKKRMIGVDILAQLGSSVRPFHKQSVKHFFAMLAQERNIKVLTSLLYAIGHNNENLNKTQVEKVSDFKKQTNVQLRQSVVYALLSVDHNKAIDTLIYLSNDNIASIRNWATFGIGTQIDTTNNKIIVALWNRVDDTHKETQLEAIVGLAKRQDDRIKKVITDILNQGEADSLIFDAVCVLADTTLIPVLKKQLKHAKLDKTVNVEWISKLKSCISELQLKDRKSTAG